MPVSGDAADKLAACLNWASTSQDEATQAYFDACAHWFAAMTPDERNAVRTIMDVAARDHANAAKGMAAILPPAPKCPL